MKYDEEVELDFYIWRNYNVSNVAQRAIQPPGQSGNQPHDTKADCARRNGNGQGLKPANGDQQARHILEDRQNLRPHDHYRLIRKRYMEQFGDRVVIARCDRCEKIVRTAEAQQCLWCGHAWREV